MKSERFVYIWQYTIDPSRREAFLAAYNPNGEWARLFSRDPSYITTALLHDVDDANRFLTIDYWKSKSDRDAFRQRYSVEFADLDKRCEAFTRKEQFLGDFTALDQISK